MVKKNPALHREGERLAKTKRPKYFVYLIECGDQSIYTGITTDVPRRFKEHKNGKGGHYTSSRQVVKVLYTEKSKNRGEALKREAEIKKLSREQKLNLVG
jgi:putative endonuclease